MSEKRMSHSTVLMLEGPIERVLPLFGPRREAEWAEGWSPEFLYRETEDADHAGAVFATTHGPGRAIWHVNRFDSVAGEIEYLRVEPGTHVARIEIHCQAAGQNRTRAEVRYTFTALTEAGEQYLQQIRQHQPQGVIEWQEMINAALGRQG